MRYFPAFLELQGKPCLIVGATDEARHKAEVLRQAGAAVTAVETVGAIPTRTFVLAVVATGDLDRDEAAACRLDGQTALINVVDRPSLCSFVWPAIVDRGPVTIAISTGGASPTLARLIRERIEQAVPAAVGELARLAGRWRRLVAASIPSVAGRRAFWRTALAGRAGALAFADRGAEARGALNEAVREAATKARKAS